jgi:diamine N-acetyltransferase
MLYLRDVDKDNFQECIALDVNEEQRPFVAPNIRSLAQAYVYRDVAKVFLLYDESTMVGFALLQVDHAKMDYWLCRLMIDRRFQHKGHGREALGKIIDYFTSIKAKTVKLSIEPENHIAERLYAGCGFYRNGEENDGEIVMQLDL